MVAASNNAVNFFIIFLLLYIIGCYLSDPLWEEIAEIKNALNRLKVSIGSMHECKNSVISKGDNRLSDSPVIYGAG
jgi:hypothetical protein